MDINGKMIESRDVYSNDEITEFNLESFEKGIYILQIKTPESMTTTKIIRE